MGAGLGEPVSAPVSDNCYYDNDEGQMKRATAREDLGRGRGLICRWNKQHTLSWGHCPAPGPDGLQRCGGVHTSWGIHTNLEASARIIGCNFEPVLMIVLLERLIMTLRISSSSKTGCALPNFKLATQINFFHRLFIINLLILFSQNQARISVPREAFIESNNHNLKLFFYPRKL